MILVDNYFLAILCCVICCACWGSWANTQKMVAAKQWSFELFYWDLTVGLFLTALLGAVTLGSMGSEGRTFFQDLAVMDWSSIQYAFLGGVVWNFGNIFLTAAIAVAGMSVGFPIGGGLAWIGGIVFNYLLISLAGRVIHNNLPGYHLSKDHIIFLSLSRIPGRQISVGSDGMKFPKHIPKLQRYDHFRLCILTKPNHFQIYRKH